MKNKGKYIFILTLIVTSLFYRADSIVAMAEEETVVSAARMEVGPDPVIEAEVESGTEAELGAEPAAGSESGLITEPAAGSEPEAEPGTEPTAGSESELEPDTEPAAGPEPESGLITEPAAGPESEAITEDAAEPATGLEPIAGPEAVMTFTIKPEPAESVSTGPDLIEWLETHKNTGGTVKLSDNVVLDGYYSFCPDGMNRPAVFVDTDKYTITVAGEIEFLSDNHLIFSGEPGGKSIFNVANRGMLSMEGITVEGGQYTLWQEEGAGLLVSNCSISGNIHYADTPFVVYYNNFICAVVEKGQTLNDALPTQISCTLNRQGGLNHNEWIPVSWNLEGTERQQEERRRFAVQGSFLNAVSAEPVQCTVVYNDAPLTFTDVNASVSGSLYTFKGGFTVPEESLPFTIMAEYSFDGENWLLYEEQGVKNTNAGFYISCKLEPVSRAAHSNIYIRLQWNDNGTRYFSNVLCYATNDIESAEDIGGSRGGGTSIVNLPGTPQENISEVSSEKPESDQGIDQDTDHDTDSDTAGSEALSDEKKADTTGGSIDIDASDGGQVSNTGHVNADAGQSLNAESANIDVGQSPHAESANTDIEPLMNVEQANIDAESKSDEKHISSSGSDTSNKEEAVATAIFARGENNANPPEIPEISEQTLRSDPGRNYNIVIAAGAAVLSVIAGAAGFCVHSLSGTKR